MNWFRVLVATVLTLLALPVTAQPVNKCRLVCELELKIEPTFTIDNLAKPHRVEVNGITDRVSRDLVFETVFALDMSTPVPWLGFTAEAMTAPFADDNDVQLEFETNFHWLSASRTGGWVSSHFDVVDKFSPAGRPQSTRAYTHKLDFELDTALHIFNWLPEGRWLRGVEFETSLDYLATGLPQEGDVFSDGSRYLDDASRWSLSFVVVLPVAPF